MTIAYSTREPEVKAAWYRC